MLERIQKVIARAGVSSRRAAEELVTSGRVRVNGLVVTELGSKADPFKDKIEVDGKRLVPEDLIYVVLHKPRNVVATMSDPEGRPTVAAHFAQIEGRVYPVGRLDFATSGVLLATNDGEFANGLLHPKKEVPKTYVVKALGVMTDHDLDVWRDGVQLDDGKTLPTQVRFLRHEGDKTWFELTLREGRNQQIRRMGEATGFRVGRLARLTFAGVTSEGLRPGEWRHLTRDELMAIRESWGVPKRVRAGVGGGGGSPPPRTSNRAAQARPAPRAEREERPAAHRPSSAGRSERSARPSSRASSFSDRGARSASPDFAPRVERGARSTSQRAGAPHRETDFAATSRDPATSRDRGARAPSRETSRTVKTDRDSRATSPEVATTKRRDPSTRAPGPTATRSPQTRGSQARRDAGISRRAPERDEDIRTTHDRTTVQSSNDRAPRIDQRPATKPRRR